MRLPYSAGRAKAERIPVGAAVNEVKPALPAVAVTENPSDEHQVNTPAADNSFSKLAKSSRVSTNEHPAVHPSRPAEQTRAAASMASNVAAAAQTQNDLPSLRWNQESQSSATPENDKSLVKTDSAYLQTHAPRRSPQQTLPGNASSILLRVTGLRPNQGDLKIAVFHQPANFPDSSAASSTLQLASDQSVIECSIQADRPLAIAVYQDINRDGELTRNRFGIPVEPFGFSNNARSERGPPSFAQAQVAASSTQNDSDRVIQIDLP